MATITAFIRVSTKKAKQANVRFRLRDGRAVSLVYASKITVKPDYWDAKKEGIKAKVLMTTSDRVKFEAEVRDTKNLIARLYNELPDKSTATSSWLKGAIDRAQNPAKYEPKKLSFIEEFSQFIENRPISEVRKRCFRVMTRDLKRFELYKQATNDRDFILSYDAINGDVLREFDKFLIEEHTFFKKNEETGALECIPAYKTIYEAVPESRIPEERGQNTRSGIFSRLRTFFKWARDTERTKNDPFRDFEILPRVYGDPYYVYLEEINQLYNTDLSAKPTLAAQRDIFVFQSLIGCRVGDLYSLTKNSIIDGAVEYIAHKTKDGNPSTTRVVLNPITAEILERYKDTPGAGIFPLISQQKYNQAIKKVFTIAGLTRPVTILNPTTRQPEIKPLNEIASSHLARRNFIGNQVKAGVAMPIICSQSGHSPGSRAIARYYKVDDQMKQTALSIFDSIQKRD